MRRVLPFCCPPSFLLPLRISTFISPICISQSHPITLFYANKYGVISRAPVNPLIQFLLLTINYGYKLLGMKPIKDFALKPFSHYSHFVPTSDVPLPGSTGEFSIEMSQESPDSDPPCQNMQSEFSDRHLRPCGRKTLESGGTVKSEDSKQSSPVKKRKKGLEIVGPRRCTCKKSKCLKLYCECFAATRFCNKTCACEGCSNIPELVQVVYSTRIFIEFRNPLAFAPKVVDSHDYEKENGDNKHITLPSARHKRGCNCKKSKCLKKYCDCYHAGVGCSVACQCNGCMNTHGKKIVVGAKNPEEGHNTDLTDHKLEVLEANNSQSYTAEEFNCEKDATKLQISESFHPSSESNDVPPSSFQSPTSTTNQTCNSAQAEENEEPSSVIPYSQQLGYSSSPKDTLSRLWKELPDICNLSPLPDLSRDLYISSASPRTGHPRTNFFVDAEYLLGSESLHYHSPPSSLPYNLTDEIHKILKDTHSSIKPLNISPNQKRVSPHRHEPSSSYSSCSGSACRILQFTSHSNLESSGK